MTLVASATVAAITASLSTLAANHASAYGRRAPALQTSGAYFPVSVVDSSGNDVDDAQVWYLDPAEKSPLSLPPMDIDSLVDVYGARAELIGSAAVLARGSPASTMVVGRKGDLWGVARTAGELSVPRLVLSQDQAIAVRVVDANMQPAGGVTVALQIRDDAHQEGQWDLLYSAAVTNDVGVACVPHVAFLLSEAHEHADLCIAIASPLTKPVWQRVEPHASEEIVLRLPPTGSVQLVFDNHKRIHNPIVASIHGAQSVGVFARPSGGDVIFRHVEVGVKVSACLSIASFADARIEGHGPSSPDDMARLQLSVDESLRVMRGRVLSSDETPLADFCAELKLYGSAGLLLRQAIVSDGDGVWEAYIPGWARPSLRRIGITGRIDKNAPMECSVELERWDWQAPEMWIGEHKLIQMPVIASGRVVDGIGRPFSKSRGMLFARDAETSQALSGLWMDGLDEDGAFAVYGAYDGTVLPVRVWSADRGLSQPLGVRRGKQASEYVWSD